MLIDFVFLFLLFDFSTYKKFDTDKHLFLITFFLYLIKNWDEITEKIKNYIEISMLIWLIVCFIVESQQNTYYKEIFKSYFLQIPFKVVFLCIFLKKYLWKPRT